MDDCRNDECAAQSTGYVWRLIIRKLDQNVFADFKCGEVDTLNRDGCDQLVIDDDFASDGLAEIVRSLYSERKRKAISITVAKEARARASRLCCI